MTNKDTEKKIIKTLILIRSFIADKKVGSISVNMFKGGISSVNINETENFTTEENL